MFNGTVSEPQNANLESNEISRKGPSIYTEIHLRVSVNLGESPVHLMFTDH